MRLDFTLVALAAPLAVLGDLRHSARRPHNHHNEVAKRANNSVELHKRFSGARWTFYDVGGAAGACGQVNSPDQHTVALNSAQYGGGYPGPNCFKQIVMIIGDKQTTATITDECPGCPYGGLDLTRGLFGFFADLGVGVLTGEWYFADEAPSDSKPTPKPDPPKPTPKPDPPKPEPTTSYTPDPPKPTPTSHTTPTPTSYSSSHSSSHSSSASSSAVSSASHSSSASTTPSAIVTPDESVAQNILACNQLLVNYGGMVIAGLDA